MSSNRMKDGVIYMGTILIGLSAPCLTLAGLYIGDPLLTIPMLVALVLAWADIRRQ